MKKIIIIVTFALLALFTISYLKNSVDKLKEENEKLISNTELLLADIETYKINDSISVATTDRLYLTIDQLEQSLQSDKHVIEQLTKKNYDLENLVASQSKTIYELYAVPKDTTIVIDTTIVNAQNIVIHDKWFDFEGLLYEDSFVGTFESRDSLLLLETVKYKRFLFIKTKKIKDRNYSIVSKNPHSTILGFDVISIIK